MDVTPPTDSDEVKAWVAAIDWTKVSRRYLSVPRVDSADQLTAVLPSHHAGPELLAQRRQLW
jgi:hypothetical protein